MRYNLDPIDRTVTFAKDVDDLRITAKKLYTDGEKNRIFEIKVYRGIALTALFLIWLLSIFWVLALQAQVSELDVDIANANWSIKYSNLLPVVISTVLLFTGIALSKIGPRNEFRSSNKLLELWIAFLPTTYTLFVVLTPFLNDWFWFLKNNWAAIICSILITRQLLPFVNRVVSFNKPVELQRKTWVEFWCTFPALGLVLTPLYIAFHTSKIRKRFNNVKKVQWTSRLKRHLTSIKLGSYRTKGASNE